MARTNAPDSATSQFFINVVDNPNLDTTSGGYAVFGKVVSGLDIVDKIKSRSDRYTWWFDRRAQHRHYHQFYVADTVIISARLEFSRRQLELPLTPSWG